MKIKMIFMSIILILVYSSSLYPAEEDWYIHLYIGLAPSVSYPDWVEDEIDWVETNVGSLSKSSLEYELGFYWPIKPNDSHKNILGFMLVTGVGTLYTREDDSIYAMSSLGGFSLSYQHYFGDEVGEGPFFRTDAGILGSFISVKNDFNKNEDSKYGFGYLLGGGYSWLPEGWETRISVQGHYQGVSADGSSSIFSLGVAWLF